MNLITPLSEFKNIKSRGLITLECKNCKNHFTRVKSQIQKVIAGNKRLTFDFCSTKCNGLYKTKTRTIKFNCENCGKLSKQHLNEFNTNKHHFCSHSCAGKYNSQHRTTGTRRAKLEKWLEIKLKELYPNLIIIYNDTSAILSELDIYIPSLKLAFELNGIFHYEPIYGLEKLTKTQKRDKQKILSCAQEGIELCVIDTSQDRFFNIKKSEKFLNIIKNLINNKLGYCTESASV